MVIELAGLPGAGKTSISKAVAVKHFGRDDVGLLNTRLEIGVAIAVLKLALSAHPFRLQRIGRALEMIVVLRYYGPHKKRPIIIDQGLAQKLWSMLIDAKAYSPQRLENVVRRLAPYAADHLVWIETPVQLAAARIAGRTGGNSRFDGLPQQEIAARLARLTELYKTILNLFERHTRARVLTLRGEDSVAANAARIAALIENESKA